jgi:cytochrome c553
VQCTSWGALAEAGMRHDVRINFVIVAVQLHFGSWLATGLLHKRDCGMFRSVPAPVASREPWALEQRQRKDMINNHLPTIFGALVISAVLAAPANAAEGIEAKLQVCSSCHGDNGVPIDPTIPTIWGQTEYFLVKQLHDYKSGDRENTIMSSFAKRFEQSELRPVARYFASKTWPAKPVTATPAAATPVPNGIAVCQICHQQGFVGALPAPRLAGQSYEYLIGAMRSFANGERTNNADMVKIMEGLSDSDREAIAHYIASF